MSSDSRSLSDFERAVLDKLLAGDNPVLSVLRSQARACRASGREYTGAGFLVDLEVDRSRHPPAASLSGIVIGDVGGRIAGLDHGAGFLLFVTDGYVDCLEGVSYDEAWPETIRAFSLDYEGDRVNNPAAVDFRERHP